MTGYKLVNKYLNKVVNSKLLAKMEKLLLDTPIKRPEKKVVKEETPVTTQ